MLEITFPTNTVFVRKTLVSEIMEHAPNIDPQTEAYTVVNNEGELLAIFFGSWEFAFSGARSKNADPVWMH